MEEINKYIDGDGDDYGAGVELFMIHGRSQQLKRLFSNRNPSPSMIHKLRYELGKLVGRHTIIEASAKIQPAPQNWSEPQHSNVHLEAQPTRKVERLALPMMHDEVDEDELANRKRSLHAERAKLSNSLHTFAMNDDDGRKAAVERIKDLTRQMNEIRLEQRGEKPQLKAIAAIPVKELPSGVAELISERNNLRANISKAKAKLTGNEVGSPSWMKYDQKLKALEARLKEVEDRIG